jgi:outer membrane murein-binding lipoprotein Lpp
MTPADFTLAPLLRGRRARRPLSARCARRPSRGFGRATSQGGRPGGGCRMGRASSMTRPKRFLGIWPEADRRLLTKRGAPRFSGPSPNADRRARRRPTRRISRRGPRSTPRTAILRVRPRIRASRLDRARNLAEAARSRSHFYLVANKGRGSVNSEGELEFDDATKISGSEMASKPVPQVRVFNRDFINATLSQAGGIAPIYFLGEDSVEKQARVDQLKKDRAFANAEVMAAETEKTNADSKLDDFCRDTGRLALLRGAHLGSGHREREGVNGAVRDQCRARRPHRARRGQAR